MDLTQLANLGEFIGGVAVLVTLVYLAVQVRQGSVLVRVNAQREMNASLSAFLGGIAKDRDLHHIWFNGLYQRKPLSEEELDRLGMLLYQCFAALDTWYHSSELNPSLKGNFEKLLDRLLGFEPVQDWWSRQGALHGESFRSHVDDRLTLITTASNTSNDGGA